MSESVPTKSALWKECKNLGITFETTYANLKISDLQSALKTRTESLTEPPIASPSTPPKKSRKTKALSEEDLRLLELKEQAKIAKRTAAEAKARTSIERAELARLAIEKEHEIAAAKEAKKLADLIAREDSLNKAKARKIELQQAKAQEIVIDSEQIEQVNLELTGTKDIEAPGKKFRCQNQRFMLTYKTHLDKELVVNFFADKNAKETIVAHERASSETDYEHSHVYVDFGRNYQSTNARVFDISNIHPHIGAIKSAKHLENIWAYLCKEDKSNEHLLNRITDKTLFDKVAACRSIQDAMRLAKTPSEASGLATLYSFRPQVTVEPEPLEHQWQLDLITELESTPHKRKIIWYYDNVGNTGKSSLAIYAQAKGLATVISQLGGDRDSGQLIETARDSGWDGRAVIIDLPRQGEHRSIYSPMESIKNGLVTNVKYRGGTTTFARPHLIVMANFLPRVHEMSLDRWDIRELNCVGEYPERVVTVNYLNVHDVARRTAQQAEVQELMDELKRRTQNCETKRELLQRLIDDARFELTRL